MKSALWRDNFREIKASFPRFLSILAIILLGVAFYIGIQVSGPTLLNTADDYFHAHHLPDGQVIGTLGLTDHDVALMRQVDGLDVQPLQSISAQLAPLNDKVKFYSYDGNAAHNLYAVVAGRLPESASEITLDSKYLNSESGIQLGDTVTVDQVSDYDDQTDYHGMTPIHFKQRQYTVVGFAQSSLYYDRFDRGQGGINGFAVVMPEAIGGDLYTEALYWHPDNAGQPSYTDAYRAQSQGWVDQLEEQFKTRPDVRLQEVKDQLTRQLDAQAAKIREGEQQLADGRAQLLQARADLDQGWADYRKGLSDLDQARAQLVQGEQDYQSGLAAYQQGVETLASQRERLLAEEARYQAGYQAYQRGAQLLDTLGADPVSALAHQEQLLKQGQQQAADSLAQLTKGQSALDQGREQLAEAKRLLESQLPANEGLPTQATDLALMRLTQHLLRGTSPTVTPADLLSAQAQQLTTQLSRLLAFRADLVHQEQAIQQGQQTTGQALDQLRSNYPELTQQLLPSNAPDSADLTQVEAGLTQQIDALTELQQDLDPKLQTDLGSYRRSLQQALDQVTLAIQESERTVQQLQSADGSYQDPQVQALQQEKGQLIQAVERDQQAVLSAQIALATAQGANPTDQVAVEQAQHQLTQAQTQLASDQERLTQVEQALDQLATSQPERLAEAQAQLHQQLQTQARLQEQLRLVDQLAEQFTGASSTQMHQQLNQQLTQLTQAQAQIRHLQQEQAHLAEQSRQLEVGWQHYHAAQTQLQQAQAQLQQARDFVNGGGVDQLEQSRQQLQAARTQLDQGQAQLGQGQAELDRAVSRLADARAQLAQGQASYQAGLTQSQAGYDRLNQGEQELATNQTTFDQEVGSRQSDLQAGRDRVAEAQDRINQLKAPTYLIHDRSAFQAYGWVRDSADQLQAISHIFPVFFLLIAVLVTFSTIRRMVSEQRLYMGTMLQLGYPPAEIILKFLTYAGLASVIGIVLGLWAGYHVFPPMILDAFRTKFYLTDPHIHVSHLANALITGVALLTALIPAAVQPLKILQEPPASLLMPEPPRSGKEILLERWPRVWNWFTFKQKMTIRNLMRYKGRNLLTLIGVAGCTMLMVTGFGISDTIKGLTDTQIQEIQTNDGLVYLNDELTEPSDQETFEQAISQVAGVRDYYPVHVEGVKTAFDEGNNETVSLIVPLGDAATFGQFMNVRQRDQGDHSVDLTAGPAMTERLAEHYRLHQTGTITIQDNEQTAIQIPIHQLAENYIGHMIYLTSADYARYVGQAPKVNAYYVHFAPNADAKATEQALGQLDRVATVIGKQATTRAVSSAIDSLSHITVVLIISAAGLAFVVLYNLTNINIGERISELATIKVLGFYDLEVSLYIYDEILVLSMIGGAIGLGLGHYLNHFIMKAMQIGNLLFYPQIRWTGYVWAFVLTILFSAIVMLVMHVKLKRIDVVEAMKAVD